MQNLLILIMCVCVCACCHNFCVQIQLLSTYGCIGQFYLRIISVTEYFFKNVILQVESLKSKFLTPLSDMLRKVTYTIQQVSYCFTSSSFLPYLSNTRTNAFSAYILNFIHD